MAERHNTDALFKALADPSRRKLLDLLHAHDGRTLNELCEHLDMTRQGVTQHLDLLEAANLIAIVRRGREKLHFLIQYRCRKSTSAGLPNLKSRASRRSRN
jgi:DNA-binding transcriptional ArsR family regulator